MTCGYGRACPLAQTSPCTTFIRLEAHVMQDHGIPSSDSKSPSSLPSPPESPKAAPLPERQGFLKWIFGRRNDPPAQEEKKPSAPIKRAPSFAKLSAIPKRRSLPSSSPSSPPAPIGPASDPLRFSKLCDTFRDAVCSASPSCHYPVPHIFLRLRAEEEGYRTIHHVMNMSSRPSNKSWGGPLKTNSNLLQRTSSILLRRKSMPDSSTLNDASSIPQSITAYSLLRIPDTILTKKLGLNHIFLDTHSVDSFIRLQQLTFTYAYYPIGCPQQPCMGPMLCNLSYEPHVHPPSLGDTILRWCRSSALTCKTLVHDRLEKSMQPDTITPPASSPNSFSDDGEKYNTASIKSNGKQQESSPCHGCSQALSDHTMSFSHGPGKITVQIFKQKGQETSIEKDTQEIDMWTECCLCEAQTAPVAMSRETFAYPLAKYFELILYSHAFYAPSKLCSHAKTRSAIVRCFRSRENASVTVKLNYDDLVLYDLQAPKLQVVSDDANAPLANNMADSMSSPISPKALQRWHDMLAEDVHKFFDALSGHIHVLDQYLRAEAKRRSRDTQLNEARRQETVLHIELEKEELARLRKMLLEHEQEALQHELVQTPGHALNDFRRLFKVRSHAILDQLYEWQGHRCPDLSIECPWEVPDYIEYV